MRAEKCLSIFLLCCFLLIPATDASAQKEDRRVEGYRKYTKAIFHRYDKDKNQTLSSDEIKEMRRKPKAGDDTNSDGEITFDELFRSYLAKAGIEMKEPAVIHGAVSGKKSSDGKKTGMLLSGKVTVQHNENGLTLIGGESDIEVVAKALKKMQADGLEQESGPQAFDIQIWVVKSTGTFDTSMVNGKSSKETSQYLNGLADDAETQVEEFQLPALEGRSVNVTSAKMIPVVSGVVRNRGSSRVVQKSIENRDVGTVLEIKTSTSGGMVLIDCEISKSLAEDSDVVIGKVEDENVFASVSREFTLKATVACESGKSAVIYSRQDDCSWALVVLATSAK